MRINYILGLFLVAFAIVLSPCKAGAQNGAEEPVIKSANTYFQAGDYPAAMPLYSQLLANHKEDPNYNYRYGVCVLFASPEKDKGLKFLEKASTSPGVETDVWFYLGKAYHLNYQFEQAITAYTKYKTLAGPKKAEKMQVDNQIAMCKTGRKLLKAITDITVLDKAELNEADFFRRYDLRGSGYSGQLLVKPDEFKTALDKKKNEQSIIFLSGEKTELYFASYGEDESQGKDIYVVRKLPNGSWGKPQNVGYPINTEYDEDFPFLHPNGKVLYFSSKGHSSMGGYDIFRSELNEEVGTWQKPVNLDFAINSPDDDIMFISDLDEKTAWFASNRSSPEGKMTVYHVVIERKPVNMCLIAGTFSSTPGDPNRSAKITVKNAETNEPLGVYKSNETTGKYLINLPNNGGKYSFTVDHTGIATQTENIFIPPQYTIKTLNQQVGYNEVNNESKLFILTDFDADTSMLDPAFLKDKAKLDIYNESSTATQVVDMGQLPGTLHEAGGVDSSDGTDTGEDDSTATITTGNPPAKVRNEELVKSANEDAASTQQESIDLNSQKEKAWTNATAINGEAKAKSTEAKAAKAKADAMPEGTEKTTAQQEADKLLAEANALQSQAAAAISIAQALDNDAKQKQLEADKTKQYAASLEKAVNKNDPKALDAAIAQGSELQAMSDSQPQGEQTAKNLQDEANKKHTDLEKAKTSAQDLRDEIAQNEARIKQLKADQQKEKDPDMRAGMDAQMEGINEDIADNKKDLAAADKKVALLQNQANDLDNQAKGAADAIAQSKNPAVNGSVISADDKKAMGDDAIAYQQSISESGTTRVFAPAGTTSTSGTEPTGTTTTTTTGTEPTGTTTGTEPAGTTTTGTEPTGTTTVGTDPGTDPDNVGESVDPAIAFNESLQKADAIPDPVEREKAKADVYTQWAADLDDQVKEKKQELAGTTDKTKKTKLSADIKTLQSQQDQKEKEAKNSIAAADKAQKAQLASNPSAPAVASEQFTSLLDAADTKTAVAEKENSKAQIYSDWADSLDAAAAVKENGLPKIKDKKQQEKVKTEITALRSEAGAKRNLADEAKEKAAAAQPLASATTTAEKISYSEPGAATALKEQQTLLAQSEASKAKRDSLSALAGTAKGAEKTQLLTAASDQQRQAWEKEAQASAKLGEADKIQFDKNDQQLKNLDVAAISSNDQDASVAALLSAEARNLFDKAKQQRDSANATSNNFIKTEALQNAEENERKGLQKQQEALALYKKAGIQPIASITGTESVGTSTTGTNPVGTSTTGTESVGTSTTGTTTTGTNPVGTSTTGTEPVGTSTTGTSTTGTNPVGTSTTGTEPVGTSTTGTTTTGTNPVGTSTTGTETVGTSTTGNTTTAQYIDPSTNQPLTSVEVNEVRGTAAYKNYLEANKEAIQADKETAQFKTQADEFQASADKNVAKAQELSLQAADEKNKKKKQELIDNSKEFNAAATDDIARRDSVNELADAASMNANANRNKAKTTLQSLDPKTAEQVKAIAAADVQGIPMVVRTVDPSGTSTTGTLTTGTEPTGTSATATSTTGTSTAGTEPTGTSTAGTVPTGTTTTGTNPVGTSTTGTEPVGTSTTGTTTTAQYIDPSTNQPLTSVEVNEVRGTAAYKNYLEANKEAIQADKETAQFKTQADEFQASADKNVAKAQELSLQAADEKNKKKKQELIDNSKEFNAAATDDIARRDSVNELADAASMNANANRNKAKTTLQSLDPKTAEQVKAIAAADVQGIPMVVRTGDPSGTSTTGTSTTGTEPTGTSATATSTTGTEPTGATSTTNPEAGTRNPSTSASVTTRLAPGEELKLASPSATTSAAPTIAVNPSLPEGLVYKVQIGAFRNPISAAIYNGISPVTAETTASGLTRYTAGLFNQFANADAAKSEIRALGYKDAFVVAFYNGKRISIDEARRMSGEPAVATTGTQPTGTQTTVTQPATTGTEPAVTRTEPATTSTSSATSIPSTPNAAKTTDVKELKGLFYTVQVGVYKNEVTKAKLKNLPDLVSERINGFIRYSSGKYCTAEDAAAAKNNAVAKGIPDAFVTAYYNGKRISVSEAQAFVASGVTPCQGGTTPTVSTGGNKPAAAEPSSTQEGGNQTGSSSQPTATEPTTNNNQPTITANNQQPTTTTEPITNNQQPTTSTTEPSSAEKSTLSTKPPVPSTGLVFSVQIGAFREEVPVEIANQFLQLASKGVKNYLDQSTGLTVYQVGVCLSKEEAEAFRSEAVAVGITDAFIVAFKDGQKITMEEAMELLRQ